MIDGVLEQGKTKNDYLNELEKSLRTACPQVTDEQVAAHMEHPCIDDLPDAVSFFEKTAAAQEWGNFELVIDKGIFAMMVFTKRLSDIGTL